MRMNDKVALVTGAARGIGRATADRLAAAGAGVLCVDVNPDVEAAAGAIRAKGGRAYAHVCDVTDEKAVDAAMARAGALGGPHALVANAAIQHEAPAEDTTPEEWDRVIAVNLRGVYLCSRAALAPMRRLGGGSIVAMASVNAFWVEPGLAAYAAAKGGVISLTRSIAVDYGRFGIRCNCICPGYVETEMVQRYFDAQDDPAAARAEAARMHALGRMGRPEEVAALALFLCSDESSFCTGQPFIVDGGLSTGVSAFS